MYIYYSIRNNSGPWTLVRIVEFSVIEGVCFQRFHCTWIFHLPIRQSHCRKHHLWFQHCMDIYPWLLQHNDSSFLALKKTTFQFSTASYEFFMKPEISAEYHLVGGVLAGDNLMNLMVDYTASHCFVVLVLRLCERRPCSSFHMAWVAMGLLLHILCTV